GFIREGAIAVVQVKTVGAEVIRDVEVFKAVDVGIAVAQVQCPSGGVDSYPFRYVGEGPVRIVTEYDDTAAVIGVFKALRKKSWCAGMKDIDRLEVAAEKQIHVSIVVVVKGDGLDGIHIAVQAGRLGYIAKLPVAEVLIEDRMPEAHHQQ